MSDAGDGDDDLPDSLEKLGVDGRDQYLSDRDEDSDPGVEPDDDGTVEFPVQSPTVGTVSTTASTNDNDDDSDTMSTNDNSTEQTAGVIGRSNGETVDATPGADGTEQTEWLPSHVDEDELTDLQEQIIETAVRLPDKSQKDLADVCDTTRSTVSRALNNYDIEHPSRIDDLQDGRMRDNEQRDRIERAAIAYPNATIRALADVADASSRAVKRTLKDRRPDHLAINRDDAKLLSGQLSVNDGDPLRPYATTPTEPPEGAEAHTEPGPLVDLDPDQAIDEQDENRAQVQAQSDPKAGDEGADDQTEAPDQASVEDYHDIAPEDTRSPDATPGEDTGKTDAEQRLDDVRGKLGTIARVTESDEVENVCRELFRTAGGEGYVTDAGLE